MRRSISTVAAVTAAAALLVAGCSSSVNGSAQAGSATSAASSSSSSTTTTSEDSSSSNSTESDASSSDVSESSSSSDVSDSGASGGATPADLDAATSTWFTTFCTRLSDLTQYQGPSTTGQTLQQEQATVVEAYTNLSSSASTSVGLMQSVPPPTQLDPDVPAKIVERFTKLADAYGRGAQSVQALTPSSEADLKAEIDKIEADAASSQSKPFSTSDPSVLAAAQQLPECAPVLK